MHRELFSQRQGTLSRMVDSSSILFSAQRAGSLQAWSLPALLDEITVQLRPTPKLANVLRTR